jgi:hypothetical protein
MPKKYDELRKKFYTQGLFCSWSCMKAFAIDKYGVNFGGRICGNIVCMRKQMYGIVGPVKIAPNRYKLEVFGGTITIDDFRKETLRDEGVPKKLDEKPMRDVLIPFVSNTPETVQDIKSSDLKLKREKPLQRTHNSLESALGLRIKPKQLSQE